MQIEVQFDERTNTLTYIVFDKDSKDAVVIDPVLDYNPNSGQYWYESADKVVDFVRANELNVHIIIETHAHADHLTSSQYLKEKLKAKIAIGESITLVQKTFAELFNLNIKTDGSQFDILTKEGEDLVAGTLVFKPIHTPGHTPADMVYLINDTLFTGDALFMPDFGTGRCDFPGGSAEDSYDSITKKLYSLHDSTRVFVGHDYGTGGREIKWETTIGESKKFNVKLNANMSKDEFVKFRSERDVTLDAPRLLLPSIQVNIEAGKLPDPESNGLSYLKLPLRERK